MLDFLVVIALTVVSLAILVRYVIFQLRASRFYAERRLLRPGLAPSLLSSIWWRDLTDNEQKDARKLRNRTIRSMLVGVPLTVVTLAAWDSVPERLNPFSHAARWLRSVFPGLGPPVGDAAHVSMTLIVLVSALTAVSLAMYLSGMIAYFRWRHFLRERGRYPWRWDLWVRDIWARGLPDEDKVWAEKARRRALILTVGGGVVALLVVLCSVVFTGP